MFKVKLAPDSLFNFCPKINKNNRIVVVINVKNISKDVAFLVSI